MMGGQSAQSERMRRKWYQQDEQDEDSEKFCKWQISRLKLESPSKKLLTQDKMNCKPILIRLFDKSS